MTKASDLRDQSIEELSAALEDARKALFLLKGELNHGGNKEQPHRKALKRKDIARLMTVLHEKQTASCKCAI